MLRAVPLFFRGSPVERVLLYAQENQEISAQMLGDSLCRVCFCCRVTNTAVKESGTMCIKAKVCHLSYQSCYVSQPSVQETDTSLLKFKFWPILSYQLVNHMPTLIIVFGEKTTFFSLYVGCRMFFRESCCCIACAEVARGREEGKRALSPPRFTFTLSPSCCPLCCTLVLFSTFSIHFSMLSSLFFALSLMHYSAFLCGHSSTYSPTRSPPRSPPRSPLCSPPRFSPCLSPRSTSWSFLRSSPCYSRSALFSALSSVFPSCSPPRSSLLSCVYNCDDHSRIHISFFRSSNV